MDDDPFGTSVWGDASTSKPIAGQDTPATQDDFDDFDDFNDSNTQTIPASAGDDDFGDFGDFDAPPIQSTEDFRSGFASVPPAAVATDWEPLRLYPLPSSVELTEQIDELLSPLWSNVDLSSVMTREDIRQAEGLNQVLVTPESRALYKILFPSSSSLPSVRPPNWTRSKIRRQHLITLGIPVNLDEMLPHANGKPLPALQISTRPMSAPPGPRPDTNVANGNSGTSRSRVGSPRSGTPQPQSSGHASHQSLGPKPALDEAKINEILNLDTESLSLLPLPELQKQLAAIHAQTANISALLTYLLQSRDALQQDSETYNGLIAELVGEAQKMKTKGAIKGRGATRTSSLR